MYRFWNFGLKLPIHAPFWGVFGEYFPIWRNIVQTTKRIFLGRKHVVWAIQRKNQYNGSTRARDREKKNSIIKKSHKSVIFPLFWGSPHWTDSTPKVHGGWCPRRNHVCQVSNWSLRGLRFYRGSNFRFSHWFLHESYNSAALMRCLWLDIQN